LRGKGIRAILIAGPTASGKSAIAVRLAQAIGGIVVNADSMQVYRDLAVITARPTLEEEGGVPHRLFGHVDGALNFSVARYIAEAERALEQAREAALVPIFVGGTGLYFKALTQGLSAIPPVPEPVRQAVRAESQDLPAPELHRRLAEVDPETAKTLRPSDPLRVLRALEVFRATGRPLVSFHGERVPGPLNGSELFKVFLAPDRDELRRRIDARFAAMIQKGALEEVRVLSERRLDPALPVMRAHGVPGLLAHFRGEATLEEAIARGQGDTRRYAKRQFTWFRHQLADWPWVPPTDALGFLRRSLAADRP
jgi:tRNA dimethylallyltransferase